MGPDTCATAAIRPTFTMAAEGKHTKKAKLLYADAVKQTKRWFGGDSRFENAAELFSKAALSFKIAKQYTESAEAYAQAAAQFEKVHNDSDQATALRDSGLMSMKAGDAEKGKASLEVAAALYEEMDRMATAGKMYKAIAEQYEEAHEAELAREFYAKAADVFSSDTNSSSNENQCRAKVAFFYGEEESFGKAAEVFDSVGSSYLKNHLLKFNARTHFANAVMCHMANDDLVMVNRKLAEYKEKDYQFADSRECKLLEACAAAYEAHDVDQFVTALSDYDRISTLDPWRIAILLKVKEHITAVDGDDGGDGEEVDLS